MRHWAGQQSRGCPESAQRWEGEPSQGGLQTGARSGTKTRRTRPRELAGGTRESPEQRGARQGGRQCAVWPRRSAAKPGTDTAVGLSWAWLQPGAGLSPQTVPRVCQGQRVQGSQEGRGYLDDSGNWKPREQVSHKDGVDAGVCHHGRPLAAKCPAAWRLGELCGPCSPSHTEPRPPLSRSLAPPHSPETRACRMSHLENLY